jgi:hypothetical protein
VLTKFEFNVDPSDFDDAGVVLMEEGQFLVSDGKNFNIYLPKYL